jgi:hypothetical protein
MITLTDKNGKEYECKSVPLWWQLKGLTLTASGYGAKLPTEWKVFDNNRWKRVYCCIYSNSGTLYILRNGKEITLH